MPYYGIIMENSWICILSWPAALDAHQWQSSGGVILPFRMHPSSTIRLPHWIVPRTFEVPRSVNVPATMMFPSNLPAMVNFSDVTSALMKPPSSVITDSALRTPSTVPATIRCPLKSRVPLRLQPLLIIEISLSFSLFFTPDLLNRLRLASDQSTGVDL